MQLGFTYTVAWVFFRKQTFALLWYIFLVVILRDLRGIIMNIIKMIQFSWIILPVMISVSFSDASAFEYKRLNQTPQDYLYVYLPNKK